MYETLLQLGNPAEGRCFCMLVYNINTYDYSLYCMIMTCTLCKDMQHGNGILTAVFLICLCSTPA